MASITSSAQVSYGDYVPFPNGSIMGYLVKPHLAFGKVNDQDLLVLKYVNFNNYASFDQTSQILLKINGEIIHLPFSKVDTSVAKDFKISTTGNVRTELYITYSSFDIDKETVDKIVNKGGLISKIRVIFTNGENKDWDIKESYQPKLTKKLTESYRNVKVQDTQRKGNMDNDESGF